MKVTDEVRYYLRKIGSVGGKKSKRTITPEQQRKMQEGRKCRATTETSSHTGSKVREIDGD
jgi:hypothetical protein